MTRMRRGVPLPPPTPPRAHRAHRAPPRGRDSCRAALAAVVGIFALGAACAAVQAARHQPGVVAGGAFSPARAAAASYGPDPARTCPPGGPMKLLEDDLAAVAKDSGKPQAKPDGRLCAAADTFLGWDRAEPPPESVTRFVADYFGLVGLPPRVIVARLESEDSRLIVQRLLEPVGGFAARAVEPRFGLATQRLAKDSTRVVLVMQDMPVELAAPLPRRLAPNGQAALGGQLLGDLTQPRVLVSDASGKLSAPPAQPGKAFRADLRCGDRQGRIVVEIRGQLGGAETVLARFPVECASGLASSAPLPPPAKEAPVAEQEKGLLKLVNAERAVAGVPALAWDDAVAGVARGASASFRDEAQRGGSSGSFDVVSRLKQADVPSLLVLLNPVSAPTAEEAQARLLSSPVHRSNLLNPEATSVGVGVVAGSAPEGGSVLYVTELLVRELPPVDTAAVRTRLHAAIARKRADARAGPLASDPALEQVSQKYAEELAGARGQLADARASVLVAPLYKSFRSVNVLSGAKPDPLEFAEEPGVVAAGKLVGVGVAQGANPLLGKNAVYVVVLIGARK